MFSLIKVAEVAAFIGRRLILENGFYCNFVTLGLAFIIYLIEKIRHIFSIPRNRIIIGLSKLKINQKVSRSSWDQQQEVEQSQKYVKRSLS